MKDHKLNEPSMYSTLPFGMKLTRQCKKRDISVQKLASMLNCSTHAARNRLNGHGVGKKIPGGKVPVKFMIYGVIFEWITKIDGSIKNDVKGITKTMRYFESDEPYSTAEDIAKHMTLKEIRKKRSHIKKQRKRMAKNLKTRKAKENEDEQDNSSEVL